MINMQSANPFMMQENRLPILRTEEEKPFVAKDDAFASLRSLNAGDWGWFFGGLTIGTFVTLATTGLASAFDPCVGKLA